MANREILLLKPVEGLGGEGDQVKVRAGYARNYLLPRKIAVPVNAARNKLPNECPVSPSPSVKR